MKNFNKKVYENAAELIFNYGSNYACCSISESACDLENAIYYNLNHPLRLKFINTFKPKDVTRCAWFGSDNSKNRLARELALLFMAEMENT